MIHDRSLVIALAFFGFAATITFAADRFDIPARERESSVAHDGVLTSENQDVDKGLIREPGSRPMSTGFVYIKKAGTDFLSAYERASEYAQVLDSCLDVPDDFSEAVEEGRELERKGIIAALKDGRDERDLPQGVDQSALVGTLERLTLLYTEHASALGQDARMCGDLKTSRRIVSEDIPRSTGITYHKSVRDPLAALQKKLRARLNDAQAAFQEDPEGSIEEIGMLLDEVNAFDDTVEALSKKPAPVIQAIRSDERIMASAIRALAQEGDTESAGHLSSELQLFKKSAAVFEQSVSRPIANPTAFLSQVQSLFTKKSFITRVLRDLAAQ